MTAMSPWKMAENRTSIDVPYVDRRTYVNAWSVSTWTHDDETCHLVLEFPPLLDMWGHVIHFIFLTTNVIYQVMPSSVRGLPFHNMDGGGVRVFTPEYNFLFCPNESKKQFFQNESKFFFYQSVHWFIIWPNENDIMVLRAPCQHPRLL